MKTQTKKTEDKLLRSLIAELKKGDTRCGTGADMLNLRKQKKS